MGGGELGLESLDAIPIGISEEEADHDVVKDAIDEIVQDPSERFPPSDGFQIVHAFILDRDGGDGEPHLL